MYTNAQILAAVVSHWAQPFMGSFLAGKMSNIPSLGFVENWIKSLGIVSPNYSVVKDLMSIFGGAGQAVVIPFLSKYISQIDDATIPLVAHGIVDDVIKRGELSLAEGTIIIEEADLKALKRLLELNLPLTKEDVYIVKTE